MIDKDGNIIEYKMDGGFLVRPIEFQKHFFWYAGMENEDYWFCIEVTKEPDGVLDDLVDQDFFTDGDIPRAIVYLGMPWENCENGTLRIAEAQRDGWGDLPLSGYKSLQKYTLDEIKSLREDIERRIVSEEEMSWGDTMGDGFDLTGGFQ